MSYNILVNPALTSKLIMTSCCSKNTPLMEKQDGLVVAGALKVYRYPFSTNLHLSIPPFLACSDLRRWLPSQADQHVTGQRGRRGYKYDPGAPRAAIQSRPILGSRGISPQDSFRNKLSSGCGLGAVSWARPPSLWRRPQRTRSTTPTRGRFMNARDLGEL